MIGEQHSTNDIDTTSRFRLWSLGDIVIRFKGAEYGIAMNALGRAQHYITFVINPENKRPSRDSARKMLAEMFKSEVVATFKAVPLSKVVREQMMRLQDKMGKEQDSLEVINALLAELSNNIIVEFTYHEFLLIPELQRSFFEEPQTTFGQKGCDAYPDAKQDIEAAGRCLALGEGTACVFHLMRVLEMGLWDLAKRIGVSNISPTTEENWKVIIDQIEKRIKDLQQSPKSPQKKTDLQFYSDAATNFHYFKDAWRNYVSHSHARYNEREAMLVWTGVSTFMNRMAKG